MYDNGMKIAAHVEGVLIGVKVVPNSSRDEVVGMLGELLKIKVAKPPADGAANKAVEALIAKTIGVAASRVSVVSGHRQAVKRVLVRGVTAAEVQTKLDLAIKS
jgi:uncharacterized protein (TIGR00251 family)